MNIKNIFFAIKEIFMPAASGNEAQRILIKKINAGKPLMVARFGAVEIKALL